MNIQQTEENIVRICKNLNEETFIYEFLTSFGIPKASVTRLERGDYNSSKETNEVLWKRKLFFKVEKNENLLSVIDDFKKESRILKQKPIFIIVTDFKSFLALDLKTSDTLDIKFKDLPKHFEFFLPLIGLEKTKIQMENPADIKAAEKLGKLYDVLVEKNHTESEEQKHTLNVFLSRLLFCFFAEDTNIFSEGIFTNALASHTKKDGSDLAKYLEELFKVLNSKDRSKVPGYLKEFPYVNGGLFEDNLPIPKFNAKSRSIIIDCGSLNWANINPDIFGSMIQCVANAQSRSVMGMHYTSVINIMKVLEPLFLNELKEDLVKAGKSKKKLTELLSKLHNLRIFDPACGSGNFLIIAYKELCSLEIDVYQALYGGQLNLRLEKGIKTSQFYGIEIDDFACETAKLSLWLAEHQMNLKFEEIFGFTKPTLPLEDGGRIVCGNACWIDWDKVCPKETGVEICVVGNPPYKGAKAQNASQKKDLQHILKGKISTKSLDYIACWFLKAADYMDSSVRTSFVSTNSIYQGTQVPILWPYILKKNIEIFFCNKDFLWKNNAKNSAGVTCSIVGLTKNKIKTKEIVYKNQRILAKNISPYLIDFDNTLVFKRSKPISDLPLIQIGNEAYDGGHLIFTTEEKIKFIEENPDSEEYFKKLIGSSELIKGRYRWCLWIETEEIEAATKILDVKDRIEKVRKSRLSGGMNARSCADRPHQFRWTNRSKTQQIVLPVVSSERRNYIPMDFVDTDVIINNKAQVIYDANPVTFSLLNSAIHMAWVKVITGRLKSDYSYTAGLCYNCFPVPKLSLSKKKMLEDAAFNILDARESHSEMNLSQLYDPRSMPNELTKAHLENNSIVDTIYKPTGFKSDLERLECLFNLYKIMTSEQESRKEEKNA